MKYGKKIKNNLKVSTSLQIPKFFLFSNPKTSGFLMVKTVIAQQLQVRMHKKILNLKKGRKDSRKVCFLTETC